jgi:hypothetical protein
MPWPVASHDTIVELGDVVDIAAHDLGREIDHLDVEIGEVGLRRKNRPLKPEGVVEIRRDHPVAFLELGEHRHHLLGVLHQRVAGRAEELFLSRELRACVGELRVCVGELPLRLLKLRC